MDKCKYSNRMVQTILFFILMKKNKNNDLSFDDDFIEYNKKRFRYIKKSYNFIYRVFRCYVFISF